MSLHVGVPDRTQWSSYYDCLPRRRQWQMIEQARDYVAELDRSIAHVLRPTVARSGDHYLAMDDIVPLYGVGPTAQEAMDDYRSVAVEYYESLEEDAAELAEPLRQQLATLRQVFAKPSGRR
jgi:hypothetical protein